MEEFVQFGIVLSFLSIMLIWLLGRLEEKINDK